MAGVVCTFGSSPGMVTVTRAEIALPLSATLSERYVRLVCPGMTTPLRSHWYVTLASTVGPGIVVPSMPLM